MDRSMLALALAVAVLAAGGAETDLERAFDAAFKAGETLTAENAYKALVAARPETAPIRYFQAAEVARQMGRETLRRDRLAHYLRVEKGWNAMTEEASWYLCNNGGSAEQFERLAKAVPASETVFALGSSLFSGACRAKRSGEVMKLAEVLLAKFPDDARRRAILGGVVSLRREGVPGIGAEPVRQLLLKYPFKDFGPCGAWSFEWQVCCRAEDYPAAFCLDWCQACGAALPPELFRRVAAFRADSTQSNDVAYCRQLAPKFKEIEKFVLKPGFGAQACTLLECEASLHRHYFKPAQTNEEGAAYYDLLQKVLACRQGANSPDARTLMNLTRHLWNCGVLRSSKVDYWQKLRDAHPEILDDDILISWGLRPAAEKAKNVNNVKAFCAKHPDRAAEARRRTRDLWAAAGETKQVLADIEHVFVMNCAGKVDGSDTLGALAALPIRDAEKIAFLRGVYVRIGAHGFFNWIKRDKGVRVRYAMFKTPEGEAFVREIDEKKPAGDRFVRLAKELFGLSRQSGRTCPERAHAIMREMFAEYKAEYPGDGRPENALIDRALDKYDDLCRHDSRSSETCAEVLLKGFGKNAKMPVRYLDDICGNLRGKPDLYETVLAVRATAGGNPDVWKDYAFRTKVEALPASVDANRMGIDALYGLLYANLNRTDGKGFAEPLRVRLVSTAFSRFSLAEWHADRAVNLLRWLDAVATNGALMAKFPYDKVAGESLDREKGWEPAVAATFLEIASKGGRRDAYLKKYLDSLGRIEAKDRVYRLVQLGKSAWTAPWTGKKGDRGTDWYGEILAKHLLPTLRSIADRQAPTVTFDDDDPNWIWRLHAYFGQEIRKDDPSARQLCGDVKAEVARLLCHGLRGVTVNWGVRLGFVCPTYERALQTTNVAEMVRYAELVGRDASNGDRQTLLGLIERTRRAQAWQPLFLLANAVPGSANADVYALATRYRAEAAAKLPGVYPVGEKDPAYPLYVAADEFSRKNFEGALKLLNGNVTVFERELLKLPPDFVAWGVDQLRVQRGKNDRMLLRARKMAASVIAAEAKVTPELVAAMMLVRAESFRDQQNFEAAKLEYQSIRDNPAYHRTPAGRKAMFRAIDLMIESGASAGSQVEQTLEYWLSQPDQEIQAEAHYFLARLAFDRKDYDECIKQLKEVFAINLTHTEARFLQGKWKLATNSEVDETDVWIGKLADRTAIRPGQQLSITVQDRNLSVAGGGSSIPVVLRTDRGKDCELIHLYPSARDPNLFRGLVDVRLAAAVPSNAVLEVVGNDTATYVIEPGFLRARGLKVNAPKSLRVVDDARLAIGAGAPRTEERESEAQIESMVSGEGAAGEKALTSILRPGNPLYVAVSDRDRSLGGKGDQVTVSVSTTSGDRLGSVKLTEVKPYGGVFRGVIPTALPPPRAFASDTAAGFNPGDVINSTRPGHWRSLADGQAIKWFAVDTMGSHLVSNVTIRVEAPDEITAVRLSGVLGDDDIPIAELPASDPKAKVGLKFQSERAGNFRGEQAIREYMTRAGAPKAVSVTNFAYRPSWDGPNVARYSGAFRQPDGYDYLRLRLVPQSDAPDALRGLTLAAALDGKTFFSGKGPELQNAAFVADAAPGAHRLEVFILASSVKGDAFTLLWEPIGEQAREIPMEWFDAAKHKAVWDFLADKAVIVRTKDGFSATLNRPVRLRTIKWEFAGRRSPDVAVSALTATDADGRLFLPVRSDFSDAQSNDTLEVAPGDQIVVTYDDDATASGSKRVLEQHLESSFTDGTIGIYFEALEDRRDGYKPRLAHFEAFRYVPGDTLVVIVRDSDLDTTEKADSVEATVRTPLGGEQKIRLLERTPSDDSYWTPDDGVHTGEFLGLLKTVDADAKLPTNAVAKTATKLVLRTRVGDAIDVAYIDRENTLPGVPCQRTAGVCATKQTEPRLTLFHTRSERVADRSEEARLRLLAIRKRAGNEKVEKVYTTIAAARPMSGEEMAATNAIPVNIDAPILVRVCNPSHARHAASFLTLEAVTERELERAKAEGDEPTIARARMSLGGSFGPVKLLGGQEDERTARRAGSFNGYINLAVGSIDNADEKLRRPAQEARDEVPNILAVNGNDLVRVTVRDGERVVAEKTLSLVSGASLALVDSTWSAERGAVHAGERLFVQVRDADRDVTDEADRITVGLTSLVSGRTRTVVLTETIPHSGVFNGTVRPVLFAKAETIPACATGGVATVDEQLSEDRFAASFGDRLLLTYRDEKVLPGNRPVTLCATGTVHRGSDGSVRLFSKRFRDSDQAVLVQFRLAECLFEQAKEHRKLKQQAKSTEAIARGRFILEEALKNYPDSSHVMQGEFLLANLFQELANEAKDAKDMTRARQLYNDALTRFSTIVAATPDGEYAARAQYHKALCLEMLADYARAAEEYVKMTYLYPDSELVGDATIRLATHYYTREKRFDVSARIYENFQRRFPQHAKASRALFMCGSCYIKQAEKLQKDAEEAAAKKNKKLRGAVAGVVDMYRKASEAFERLGEVYRATATPELRAQALYWAGDVQLRANEPNLAYRSLKRCVLEYPETEWARRARGLLLQEAERFEGLDE